MTCVSDKFHFQKSLCSAQKRASCILTQEERKALSDNWNWPTTVQQGSERRNQRDEFKRSVPKFFHTFQ